MDFSAAACSTVAICRKLTSAPEPLFHKPEPVSDPARWTRLFAHTNAVATKHQSDPSRRTRRRQNALIPVCISVFCCPNFCFFFAPCFSETRNRQKTAVHVSQKPPPWPNLCHTNCVTATTRQQVNGTRGLRTTGPLILRFIARGCVLQVRGSAENAADHPAPRPSLAIPPSINPLIRGRPAPTPHSPATHRSCAVNRKCVYLPKSAHTKSQAGSILPSSFFHPPPSLLAASPRCALWLFRRLADPSSHGSVVRGHCPSRITQQSKITKRTHS